MVLAKVGSAASAAMAATSASCAANARAKAGWKCSGSTRSKGPTPKGPDQSSDSGLPPAASDATAWFCSVMTVIWGLNCRIAPGLTCSPIERSAIRGWRHAARSPTHCVPFHAFYAPHLRRGGEPKQAGRPVVLNFSDVKQRPRLLDWRQSEPFDVNRAALARDRPPPSACGSANTNKQPREEAKHGLVHLEQPAGL